MTTRKLGQSIERDALDGISGGSIADWFFAKSPMGKGLNAFGEDHYRSPGFFLNENGNDVNFVNTGDMYNQGRFTLGKGAHFANHGFVENYGTIDIPSGHFIVDQDAHLLNGKGGVIVNRGNANVMADVENFGGSITNGEGATLTITGYSLNDGGTVDNRPGANLKSSGFQLFGESSLLRNGGFYSQEGGATLLENSVLTNDGVVDQSGNIALHGDSKLNIAAGSDLFVGRSGAIHLDDGAQLTDQGDAAIRGTLSANESNINIEAGQSLRVDTGAAVIGIDERVVTDDAPLFGERPSE